MCVCVLFTHIHNDMQSASQCRCAHTGLLIVAVTVLDWFLAMLRLAESTSHVAMIAKELSLTGIKV